jgi:hypothetical protein
MDTIVRKFSSVAYKERVDGWIELQYDDAIRVAMAPGSLVAAPAAGSPLGEPAPGWLRLEGTGVTSLSCTTPDCIRGVPPVQQQPEQGAFWMELQATAQIDAMDGESSCLIASGSRARIAIPIFDAALGTDHALCSAMKNYRKGARMTRCVGFHVYLISAAPAALGALQNKRIALPIPSELVATARSVRMRSSA